MKNLAKILVATAAFTTSALLPAHSAPEPSASPSASLAAAAKPKLTPFHGMIASVDGATKSFTFTSKAGKTRSFEVGSDATVLNGEAPAKFDDLKTGLSVRGSALKIADGKFKVSKLIIGEKEKATPKAEPSASASPSASPATKKHKKMKASPTASASPTPTP